MPMNRTCRGRPGYTLFELVLVLAILVVVMALAYPSVEAMYGGYRLRAGVDQVRAVWAEARARALEEGRGYRFTLGPDGTSFKVAPDSAEFWGGGAPAETSASATPPLVRDEVLPKRVHITASQAPSAGAERSGGLTPSDPNASPDAIVFLPDGTASTDAELVFEAPGGGRPIALRLRGLTGIVTTRTQDGKTGR
jgi:prepilin-type N-terminal cleavage/methylation domain-containing protein